MVDIKISEPDKYIWYSVTCPEQCSEFRSFCDYTPKALKAHFEESGMTYHGMVGSGDCQAHCEACGCPSGSFVHIKLTKSEQSILASPSELFFKQN